MREGRKWGSAHSREADEASGIEDRNPTLIFVFNASCLLVPVCTSSLWVGLTLSSLVSISARKIKLSWLMFSFS